ncbi:hypothetical protein RJ639_018859 [Escallonia herrerae]|uniref:HECT-type E3 ubiquitin transferase n=1 Tax=Escallonia herrerae TaxID=1293975 RepID=A0AA88V7K7_9ASTE|nr:hypothetical protein RJ639_018859 [Escallonia herrerae]
MFFSGDPSTRKRVDLGGRSTKERDRQKLLEQTRLERNRRLWLRQQNSAALQIQKCFRGRKAVEAERVKVREQFFLTYGKRCQNVDRHCFGPDSDFLSQLLFFFNPESVTDFSTLVEACRLLQQFVENGGGILGLFAGIGYSTKHAHVEYRAKQVAYACIQAVHRNRIQLKDQLFMTSSESSASTILLLETVVLLIDPCLPWACKIVSYLLQRNTLSLFREIALVGKDIGLWKGGKCVALKGFVNVKSFCGFITVRSVSSFPLKVAFIARKAAREAQWSTAALKFMFNLFPTVTRICGIYCKLLLDKLGLIFEKSANSQGSVRQVSSLERLLALIMSHICQRPCICPNIAPEWSFASQILTIPFLWQIFPFLKETFTTPELSQHYFHQMALCAKSNAKVLPNDISSEFPGYACLLGNVLEAAGVAFAQPDCPLDMVRKIKLVGNGVYRGSVATRYPTKVCVAFSAIDFVTIATFLLEALPPIQAGSKEIVTLSVVNIKLSWLCSLYIFFNIASDSIMAEDEMIVGDDSKVKDLNKDLEKQISNAIDPRFLLQLTNVLFRGLPLVNGSYKERPSDKEVAAVGAACAFLHVTFNILPLERIMTVLAYRTELVLVIWNFMKRCHENQRWSYLSEQFAYLPADAPGWLLPLAVFCPVYKHMLMIVHNEEFYEQDKPLSLKDIRCLVVILRQALWQLLWLNPVPLKPTMDVSALKKHPVEFIQHRVSIVASELLSQLQDWNNRRQFTPPSDFHADGVNENFMSQAMIENTRANDILRQAPFLVPFTSRVKIFTERNGSHAVFARNRFRIRRDHVLEDAFNQLSTLSEEDLREPIRVTFINEFGVEEAGIDGGGIFKDFMENITRAAFDVQYGLFKETTDHLLYPNPGSGMIHDQHLQFFHFLGTILAKAMFEGILVDIPFATFFLSKLKQKYNYLNDLPSLDPELYRHLIFLKHYEGDISELELYFVIVNNEYGEQTVEELLPGGKNARVTNENVITFIHLVANHRLNFQIRQQSSHFLRGFQQLVQKDWIDMFNEHELQLLISGSVDGFDIDDLRSFTNYAGGYNSEHYVIDMFWEVLKEFSVENQRKFLKFVTGCSRGPLLGFKHLEPTFCIQRAAGNASEEALDRLPTSATCMNLLKLPPYRRLSISHLNWCKPGGNYRGSSEHQQPMLCRKAIGYTCDQSAGQDVHMLGLLQYHRSDARYTDAGPSKLVLPAISA